MSVDESAPIGFLVHTVRAVDADSTTEYYLLNTTSDDDDMLPFVVDKASGEVRLSGSLDFKTQRNYTLRVLVIDAASPSMLACATSTTTRPSITPSHCDTRWSRLAIRSSRVSKSPTPIPTTALRSALSSSSNKRTCNR